MYFLKKIIFHFPSREKISCSGEKNTILPDNTRKIIFRYHLFEKIIFSEHLKKISYFPVVFWERSSFIFRLGGKIIYSWKTNIIFPDNTKKIIFQHDFFGKTIFSGCLEKNTVLRAVTLLSSFCVWTKNLTHISQLTSNNIISWCKSHSELCTLKTVTAKTSWELLYRFFQCSSHCTLCNLAVNCDS